MLQILSQVRRIFLVGTVWATVLVIGAHAADDQRPSFPCDQAGNATEKTICDTSHLAMADQSMATLYRAARKQAGATVAQAQHRWILRRNRCQDNITCIEDAYQDRLFALARITGDTAAISGRYSYTLKNKKKEWLSGGELWLVREPDNTLTGGILTVTGRTAHTCEIYFRHARPTRDGWQWETTDPYGEDPKAHCRIRFTPLNNAFKVDGTPGCYFFCGASGFFSATYLQKK